MEKQKSTYCLKELKKMGWSVRLIETLLPKPTLKKNPMYACAAPMKSAGVICRPFYILFI